MKTEEKHPLREFMAEFELTKLEAAKVLGLSNGTIYNNAHREPTARVIERISRARAIRKQANVMRIVDSIEELVYELKATIKEGE